jgi:hypothetical protein
LRLAPESTIDPVPVAARHLDHLGEQARLQGRGLEAQRQELVVPDHEVVLGRLVARVRQLGHGAPVRRLTIRARSRTRWVSVIWLKTFTRSPRAGGLSSASSTQRTESRTWMKARVWPPVPWTVSG